MERKKGMLHARNLSPPALFSSLKRSADSVALHNTFLLFVFLKKTARKKTALVSEI